jgi:hypothetical protein
MVLIMLWVFILPIVIKSVHYHDQIFNCKALIEKHFHNQLEKCLICDYELSFYPKIKNNTYSIKYHIIDLYFNTYTSFPYLKSEYILFSLRAPPSFI